MELCIAGAAALVRASVNADGPAEQNDAYAERLLRGQVAEQGAALRDGLDLSTRHYG